MPTRCSSSRPGTPLDDPSNFPANGLDPAIRILDENGNELASDANSAADGKNARLTFTAPANDTYYVVVTADAGTGTYVLSATPPEGSLDGDFNGNGSYDCSDIDELTVEVVDATNNSAYDLTGDGRVDLEDRDAWLEMAGLFNGLSSGYLLADLDFSGTVDDNDFAIWHANRFTQTSAYCLGDINMDGFIGGQDLLIWNAFKFQSVLPSPSSSNDAPAAGREKLELQTEILVTKPLETRKSARVTDSVFATYAAARDSQLEQRPAAKDPFAAKFKLPGIC